MNLSQFKEMAKQAKKEGKDYLELTEEQADQYANLLVPPPSKEDIQNLVRAVEALARRCNSKLMIDGMEIRIK